MLSRTLSGSEESHHPKEMKPGGPLIRKRSYSTNDSAEYEQRLEENDGGIPRRMSLTQILLGRRSLLNPTVSDETLLEESSSLESLGNLKIENNEKESADSNKETEDEAMPDDQTMPQDSGPDATKKVTRNLTQTDYLNKNLLESFLARINSFGAGDSQKAAKGEGEKDNEESARASPRDYSVLYSDDFLLDNICRRLEKKKS